MVISQFFRGWKPHGGERRYERERIGVLMQEWRYLGVQEKIFNDWSHWLYYLFLKKIYICFIYFFLPSHFSFVITLTKASKKNCEITPLVRYSNPKSTKQLRCWLLRSPTRWLPTTVHRVQNQSATRRYWCWTREIVKRWLRANYYYPPPYPQQDNFDYCSH